MYIFLRPTRSDRCPETVTHRKPSAVWTSNAVRRKSRDTPSTGRRQSAKEPCRLHSVEDRHLHIHQDDIVIAVAYGFDCELAIFDNVDLMIGLAQQHRYELLVDFVVLRKQDSQRPPRRFRQRRRRDRFRSSGANKTEELRKGVEQ